MKIVKFLPRYAFYDGLDLFGNSLFHTKNRRYRVIDISGKGKFIQSFLLHEKY